MLKIRLLLLLSSTVLLTTFTQAQEGFGFPTDTVIWKSGSCTDLVTNTSSNNLSEFITYGSSKIKWTQRTSEEATVFEFNIQGVNDQWTSNGFVIFTTVRKSKTQTFKFERINDIMKLTLTYSTPTGEQTYVFSINEVSTL